MKRKIIGLLIFELILFLNLTILNAEGETITIYSAGTGNPAGSYTYDYWDKQTYTNVVESSLKASGYDYSSISAAANACSSAAKSNSNLVCVGTKVYTSYSYYCNGIKYSSVSACRAATYSTSSTCQYQSGTCSGGSSRKNGECTKVFLSSKYKCKLNSVKYENESKCKANCYESNITYKCSSSGSTYSTLSSCNSACKGNYKCPSNSKTYSSSSTCNSNCPSKKVACSTNSTYCKGSSIPKYAYTYRTKETQSTITESLKTTTGPLSTSIYKIKETEDYTYCIQPGKKGPGSGTTYCLNSEFDLSNCKDISSHYECGLAAILYQTVKEDGVYPDGTIKYIDNGEYSYPAISTALRMWTAYSSGIGGVDYIGFEHSNFTYISNTPVYKNTAEAVIKRGYTGGSCSSVSKGVLCSDDGYTEYIQAIKLFNNARNGKVEFLDDEESLNDPKITHVIDTSTSLVTVRIELPDEYEEKMVDCTLDELTNKSSKCQVYTKILDENGKEIPKNKIESGFCTKERCEISYYGTRKECKLVKSGIEKNTTNTVTVTLKSYGKKGGYVRQYINCADPNNTQVMMTFAFNLINKEKTTTSTETSEAVANYSHTIDMPCECDETKNCTNMNVKTDLPLSCNGYDVMDSGEYDTYTTGDQKDPYMNCILNACDLSAKAKYNYSNEYGVNTDVCQVFCRDEISFYMANKTKVYAGMQFQYDISKSLVEDGLILENMTPDHKLTSIVLEKRQCTSEIYYDKKNENGETWLEVYDKKVETMISKWNEWKKWETLDIDGYTSTPYTAINLISAGTCSNGCSGTQGTPKKTNIYTWPKVGKKGAYSYVSNITDNKNAKFDIKNATTTTSYSDGTAPSDDKIKMSTACNTNCTACVTDPATGQITNRPCGSCSCGTHCTGCSITRGSSGTNATNVVKTLAQNAKDEYYKAKKDVDDWVYDLQNCNMYNNSDVSHIYSDISHKTAINGGTSKEYILQKSLCENPADCVNLNFEYEDPIYGSNTKFEKNVGVVDSNLNNTYWCKNDDDSDPNCYEYIKDIEVELKNSNKKEKLNYIVCSGSQESAKCVVKDVNYPTNDYASFMSVTEVDFWQPKKYQVEAYTGIVREAGAISGKNTSTDLGNEVFPVGKSSKGGSTGIYDTKFDFTNVTLKSSDSKLEYQHSCSYEIYNTTNLYDCEYEITDGILNLSKCKNSCYSVKDGVPRISDECSSWSVTPTSSKGYGFIYRNVDVGSLFPNGNNRDIGTNWSNASDTIDNIEKTADEMYVTDKYLQYKYVLNNNAIKEIRNYNSDNENNGGYLNNTLYNCKKVTDDTGLEAFYNCKSNFLDEINSDNNIYGVKGIKTDGKMGE